MFSVLTSCVLSDFNFFAVGDAISPLAVAMALPRESGHSTVDGRDTRTYREQDARDKVARVNGRTTHSYTCRGLKCFRAIIYLVAVQV